MRSLSLRIRGISEDNEEPIEGLTAKLQDLFMSITEGKVSIENVDGSLRSTFDILKDLAKVSGDLSDKKLGILIEEAAGKRQADVILSILRNWESVEKSMELSGSAMGSTLIENEKIMSSLQGKLNLLSNSWQELAYNFLNSDTVAFFIDLASATLKVVDAFGLMETALISLTVYLAVSGKIAMAIPIFTTLRTSVALLATTMGASSASAVALGTAISMIAPIAIIAGIIGLVKAIDHFNVSATEMAENVTETFNEINNNIDSIKNMRTEIEALANKTELTNEEKLKLIGIERELNTKFGDTTLSIDLQNKSLEENIEITDALIKKEAERFRLLESRNYEKALEGISKKKIVEFGEIEMEFDNVDEAIEHFTTLLENSGNVSDFVFNLQSKILKSLIEEKDAYTDIITKYENYGEMLDNIGSKITDNTDDINDNTNATDQATATQTTLTKALREFNNEGKLSDETISKMINNQALMNFALNASKEEIITFAEQWGLAGEDVIAIQQMMTDATIISAKNRIVAMNEEYLFLQDKYNNLIASNEEIPVSLQRGLYGVGTKYGEAVLALDNLLERNKDLVTWNDEIIESTRDLTDTTEDSNNALEERNKLISDSITNLGKQELDQIRDKIDLLNEEKKARLDAVDSDIDALTREYEAQTKTNEAQLRALEIAKARERLANIKKEKNVRVLKGDKFVWVADPREIAKAQEDLDSLLAKEKEITRQEEFEAQKQSLEDLKTSIENDYNERTQLLETFHDEWEGIFNGEIEKMDEYSDVLANLTEDERLEYADRLAIIEEFVSKRNALLNSTSSSSSTIGSKEYETAKSSGMSASDIAAIAQAKLDYQAAFEAGDTIGMADAHQDAEDIRAKYDYSGGVDGSDYVEIHHDGIDSGFVGGKALDPKHKLIAKLLKGNEVPTLLEKGELLLNKIDLDNVVPNFIRGLTANLNFPTMQPAIAGTGGSGDIIINHVDVHNPADFDDFVSTIDRYVTTNVK